MRMNQKLSLIALLLVALVILSPQLVLGQMVERLPDLGRTVSEAMQRGQQSAQFMIDRKLQAEMFKSEQGMQIFQMQFQAHLNRVDRMLPLASSGDVEGQYLLARVLEMGMHFDPGNVIEAEYWYIKAAEQDFQEAKVGLFNLYWRQEQFNKAQVLADQLAEEGIIFPIKRLEIMRRLGFSELPCLPTERRALLIVLNSEVDGTDIHEQLDSACSNLSLPDCSALGNKVQLFRNRLKGLENTSSK